MPKEVSGYGRADVSSMRRALDSGRKLFEDEYAMSAGAHILRILPPKKDGPFFFEFLLHYLPGDKVICPATFNKACPICSLGNKLFKSDEPEEVAQGKKLYHRKAYLANVIDCRQPKGVNVIRMGKTLVSDLIELFGDENDPDDEGCNFTDPGTDGANIRIKAVMNEGDFPRYTAKIVKTGVPVPYKGWLKEMHDLPKLVESKLRSPKDLAAMVADVAIEEPEEEEEKPKIKSKGKVQEVEEEDVDSEEQDTADTDSEEIDSEEKEPEAEAEPEEEVDSEEVDSEEVDSEEVDSEEQEPEEEEEEPAPRVAAKKKGATPPPIPNKKPRARI